VKSGASYFYFSTPTIMVIIDDKMAEHIGRKEGDQKLPHKFSEQP
jgi:hypothetical protein